MPEKVITVALLIVSIIHLMPIVGFLGTNKLWSLYGINISDPNLEILMRHRSMLFGMLAALFAYAAFETELQPFALGVGFVSVLSFFYLSHTVAGFNDSISKVVIADIVALVALLIASGLYLYQKLS